MDTGEQLQQYIFNIYVTRNKGKLLRNLSYIISHLIT